jgi:hypothetical protein
VTEDQINHYDKSIDFLQRAGEAASTNPVEADRLLLVAGCHARLSQSQALNRIANLLEERLAKLGPEWKRITEA